jgi:CubicO group peptidase (beta-lactamase class C family)
MKRGLGLGLAILVLGGLVCGLYLWPRFERATMVASLFTGAEQYKNFPRMHTLFPVTAMPPAQDAVAFPRGSDISLPETFLHEGQARSVADFLKETDTAALLILKDGSVVFEDYWLTGGTEVTWLSMSVAKSFISALIGIAIADGDILSIDRPITHYVPELSGSAYDGVRIRDILQMSSGARWNEDYSDPSSDINRFARIFALGGSLNSLATTLEPDRAPGTFNRYNSTDTQVLGMLLVQATGRPIADYMSEKLWQPLGAQSTAYWLLDSDGMEMAFGGLNATARDYARLGELYRLGGKFNGRQIVPESWVRESVSPDAPHLQPGADNPASDYPLGYGYQWWIPEGGQGDFAAIGVYNQFIYVHPGAGMVIVKLSAFSNYGLDTSPSSYRELETLDLFQTLAEALR